MRVQHPHCAIAILGKPSGDLGGPGYLVKSIAATLAAEHTRRCTEPESPALVLIDGGDRPGVFEARHAFPPPLAEAGQTGASTRPNYTVGVLLWRNQVC